MSDASDERLSTTTSSRVIVIAGWIIFFTCGWPFALLYFAFARWIGFSDERRQKQEAKENVRDCPGCGRTVSTAAPICPTCDHRFASAKPVA
jgi:hypothetical protein